MLLIYSITNFNQVFNRKCIPLRYKCVTDFITSYVWQMLNWWGKHPDGCDNVVPFMYTTNSIRQVGQLQRLQVKAICICRIQSILKGRKSSGSPLGLLNPKYLRMHCAKRPNTGTMQQCDQHYSAPATTQHCQQAPAVLRRISVSWITHSELSLWLWWIASDKHTTDSCSTPCMLDAKSIPGTQQPCSALDPPLCFCPCLCAVPSPAWALFSTTADESYAELTKEPSP